MTMARPSNARTVEFHGSVDLNGSGSIDGKLNLVLGFAAQVNDKFVIIENDQGDAISGDFLGLADGRTVQGRFGAHVYGQRLHTRRCMAANARAVSLVQWRIERPAGP